MENLVIGIEGLVGAGKTSTCRELLDLIPNSIVLHGGNLYRAIIYALMHSIKNPIKLASLAKNIKNMDIKALMDKLKVKIEIENRETVFYVDGKKVDEDKIQSQETSMAVSIAGKSAKHEKLYAFARDFINMYKPQFNVIVSGRDLMNIYPDIDYHFLITASLEERIKRKCIQYNGEEYEKVKENIIKRDKLQEEAGYYKKYDKTIEVDVTEAKTARDSAIQVLQYIKKYASN